MHRKIILSVLIAACLSVSRPVSAQSTPEDSRAIELVDQLKEVIRRAERDRVDRGVVNQLRDLVRRYDWPWRAKLFFDDFADGNYTANPAWSVSRGEFRVSRATGLTSYVGNDGRSVSRTPAPREKDRNGGGSAIEGILGGILREVLEPGQGNNLRDVRPTAEIAAVVAIGNAFAVRVRMAGYDRNPEGARVEFGPYRSENRDTGYQLTYTHGQQPSLEILRMSPGRSAVVERFTGRTGLEDGRSHDVEFRRGQEGTMSVLVDGKEVMRTLDRGITESFDGFAIVNAGGEFSFSRVEIFGASR